MEAIQKQGRWLVAGWWLLVVFALVFSSISAAYSAVIVDIIALFLLPVLWSGEARVALWRERFVRVWSIAFLVLGLSFIVTAEQISDVRYILNFLPFLLAFPVFLIGRSLAGRHATTIVLLLFLGGAATAAGVSIFDIFVRGFERTEGYFSGALVIARLGLMFGFTATLGFFVVEGYKRYIFLTGPLLGFVSIYLAGARGAFLIFPILVMLFLGKVIFDNKQKSRWIVLAIIVGIILVCGLIVYLAYDTDRFFSIFRSVYQIFSGARVADQSVQSRLDFYAAGWHLFVQSPWIGYGWADIPKMAFTILNPDDYASYSLNFFNFHNDFVSFAVASGIVGIFVLIAFFAAPLIGVWTSPRDDLFVPRLFGIVIVVLTFFLSGLSDISLGFDRYTTTFTMTIAIILGVIYVPPAKPIADTKGSNP